jgi:nucleoside-diphosphate-sugar epimerase
MLVESESTALQSFQELLMATTQQPHVVTGAGPVGATVALQLADRGIPVRLLTRSGSGPEHALVERRKVDVSDREQLRPHLDGVPAVHHCIHGSKYRASTWRAELPGAEQVVLELAGEIGAVVVFPESLYSYGPVDGVIDEDTPRTATRGKLGIRADLLTARVASPTHTVSVVASDFFGPGVRASHAGERLVPRILAGKSVNVVGSLDQPHSFTYVPDLARAMVTASLDSSLWDRVLHAPTVAAGTQRRLVETIAAAAGVKTPRAFAIPSWVFKAMGLVSVDMRELAETSYQFDRPFVMSSRHSEDLLGLAPTSFEQQVKETVAWWQGQ